MARYGGDSLRDFARFFQLHVPEKPRDWSIDIGYHLAMSLLLLDKLREAGVQTTYKRRKLIEPALEDAWRQLIFIRRRYIPDDIALNDIARQVTISRTGRILVDESQDSYNSERDSSNTGNKSSLRQRLYRRKNRLKYRRRIVKKPTSR